MYADLIARTCGFVAVFVALVVLGVLGQPKFLITPQQTFSALELTINVQTISPEPESKQTEQLSPDTPLSQEAVTSKRTNPQEKIVAKEPIPETKATKVETPQTLPVQKHPQPTVKPKPIAEVKEKKQTQPNKVKEQPKTQPKKVTPPKQEQNTSQNQTRAKNQTPIAKQETKVNKEADQQLVKKQISSLLINEIKNKLKYPKNAVRRKLEGTVYIAFQIQNGVVVAYEIHKGSGHKILDEAAKKLAKSLLNLNTQSVKLNQQIIIPIKYELI